MCTQYNNRAQLNEIKRNEHIAPKKHLPHHFRRVPLWLCSRSQILARTVSQSRTDRHGVCCFGSSDKTCLRCNYARPGNMKRHTIWNLETRWGPNFGHESWNNESFNQGYGDSKADRHHENTPLWQMPRHLQAQGLYGEVNLFRPFLTIQERTEILRLAGDFRVTLRDGDVSACWSKPCGTKPFSHCDRFPDDAHAEGRCWCCLRVWQSFLRETKCVRTLVLAV